MNYTLSYVNFLGVVICGGGGVTVGGSVATRTSLSRKRIKIANQIIKEYNEKLVEVQKHTLYLQNELQKRAKLSNTDSCIEEAFPYCIKFLRNLVKGAGQAGLGTGTGLRIESGKFKTNGTAGRAFHQAGGVAGNMFLPFPQDVYTLVNSSIDVRQLAKTIAEECPTKDAIESMIEEILKQLDKKFE